MYWVWARIQLFKDPQILSDHLLILHQSLIYCMYIKTFFGDLI